MGPMVAGGGGCDRRVMGLETAIPTATVLASHPTPEDPWGGFEIYPVWWGLIALLATGAFLLALAMVVPIGMVPVLLIVRAVVRRSRSGFDDDRVAGGDGARLEHPGVGP